MNKVIAILIMIFAVVSMGCVEESRDTATPSVPAESIKEQPKDTTETPSGEIEKTTAQKLKESEQIDLLSAVVSGSVATMTDNWDADADDDGIIVHPKLNDESGEVVMFEGVELPVKIEIYTAEYDSKYKRVKGRLVYSGTGTIDSWKDGNIFFNGGIKVSFDDIDTTPSDDDYGIIYTTTTLPDGRTIEAKETFGCRIKTE